MLPNYVDFFYDSREDRCWADESILQCGDRDGSSCLMNREQVELATGNVQPATTSTTCKMKPLGLFDYWRIAPPFGNWGRALPRTGQVIHSNKVAAAGLAALRAFNIARYPVEVWPQEGFLRLPLSDPELDGPAPIGRPAMFPWVGPFPCTHALDNHMTGFQGTQAFPAGVDIASIFGGNYCQGGQADDSGLEDQPQARTPTPDDPSETTIERGSGCHGSWKAFEQFNHDQGKLRYEYMKDNPSATPQQAVAAHPPAKEMFRWIYWRHRRCTCPWPSPSWAYAEWFGEDGSRNACIKPGELAEIPKQVADLAAKTMREVGKATLNKAQDLGQEVLDTVTDTFEGIVGTVTDGLGSVLPGELSARGIEGSPFVDPDSQAGIENTALLDGDSESADSMTSSTLLVQSPLQGGHEEVNQVGGGFHVDGGLQNQHQASLQGPQSGAREIPGVADDASRPQMRLTVTERWDNVETTVYDNTEAMSVESSAMDSFNPPGNRFGTPASDFQMVTMSPQQLGTFSEPTVAQCGLPGGYDCNDGYDNFNGGVQTEWENIRFDTETVTTLGGELVTQMDVSGLLSEGVLEDTPGTGVCDRSATLTCARQRCRYRQCASNCTFSWCGEPYCDPPTMEVTRCGTVGDPPTYQCWQETVCRPCTPCCSQKPDELAARCPMPNPDCSEFHAGCCVAEQPGGIVELELGQTGIEIPGVTCGQVDPGCTGNECDNIGPCGPHRSCVP